MISKGHSHSNEIKEQVYDLNASWKRLVGASQSYFRGLEEAQDILEFNTQVEKVEAWIREKVGDIYKFWYFFITLCIQIFGRYIYAFFNLICVIESTLRLFAD